MDFGLLNSALGKRPRGMMAGSSRYQPKSKMQRRGGGIPRSIVVPGRTRVGGYYGRFKGRSGVENKFLDTANTSGIIPNGSLFMPSLNVIPQGDGESNRDGRKVTVKSVHYHLTATSLLASTVTSRVRVMVILDKQCNGAVISPGLILQTTQINSFRSMENIERFTILSDRIVDLPVSAVGSFDPATGITNQLVPTSKRVSFSKSCNIPVNFDNTATTGVIATIRSNNLCILAFSEAQNVTLGGYARIRFTDL